MPLTISDDQEKAWTLDFQKLESLRIFSKEILQDQVASLKYFGYDVGFQHYKGKNKISISSSATCVLSLVATGQWTADKVKTKALLHYLISKETSAGLPKKNPFTIAWILEAVTALQEYSDPLDSGDNTLVAKMEKMLQGAVKSGEGGVEIRTYPPSAYLTQLVVRTLRRRSKLTDDLETAVNKWAWAELTYLLALLQAKSKTAE